jgi:hypothetical protein
MVQLTKNTKVNKAGEVVDDSLYLIRFDSRNLAIVRGERNSNGRYASSQIKGYYQDVRSALKAAINIAIKGDHTLLKLETVLKRIDVMEKRIDTLCNARNLPTMMKLLRGENEDSNTKRV